MKKGGWLNSCFFSPIFFNMWVVPTREGEGERGSRAQVCVFTALLDFLISHW